MTDIIIKEVLEGLHVAFLAEPPMVICPSSEVISVQGQMLIALRKCGKFYFRDNKEFAYTIKSKKIGLSCVLNEYKISPQEKVKHILFSFGTNKDGKTCIGVEEIIDNNHIHYMIQTSEQSVLLEHFRNALKTIIANIDDVEDHNTIGGYLAVEDILE